MCSTFFVILLFPYSNNLSIAMVFPSDYATRETYRSSHHQIEKRPQIFSLALQPFPLDTRPPGYHSVRPLSKRRWSPPLTSIGTCSVPYIARLRRRHQIAINLDVCNSTPLTYSPIVTSCEVRLTGPAAELRAEGPSVSSRVFGRRRRPNTRRSDAGPVRSAACGRPNID